MKEEIRVIDKDEGIYDILVFLMRSEILKAVIHCADEHFLAVIEAYFRRLRVPCYPIEDLKKGLIGYHFTSLSTAEIETEHVYINLEKNKISIEHKDNQIIVIEDEKVNFDEIDIDIDSMPMHLKNEEIKRMFLYAFKKATTEIDIISPWLSRQVVIRSGLADLMENCIDRGVKIKIIYGIGTEQKAFSTSRSIQSEEVAEYLKNRFMTKRDRFFIKKDNIHYKLCLCDESYKLEGGFNYLSFPANYSNKSTWKEGSPLGRDKEEIKLLRETYFGEIDG